MRKIEEARKHCVCGGDIETILRENAVFFMIGQLSDISKHQLPDLRGEVLVAFLPVVEGK